MVKSYVNAIVFTMLLAGSVSVYGQRRVEPIAYGDMDQWIVRKVTESTIIGGHTKLLYEVGPVDTIVGSNPYKNTGGSPWANSNVVAKVGVTKTNTSVFPEKRGNGYCARLETRIETCVVLGIVDIKVLAAGSMFLGTVHEPIKSTKNPQSKLGTGIKFTKKPSAIAYDYKIKLSGKPNSIRSTGFSKETEVAGLDMSEMSLFLQKRWEDEAGNIYAKRVGTVVVRYNKSTGDWVNNAEYLIRYGDITGMKDFQSYMGLITGEDTSYALNSKGVSMPIHESGWGTENDSVTHVVLQFSSSHGGAYIGSPGNMMWIDNVKFIYE